MTGLLEALIPVTVVIALGYGLRRSGIMDAAGWAAVERLVYYLLFPALLFRELATAPFAGQPLLAMATTLLGAQLIMAVVAIGLRLTWSLSGPSYTSVLQGVVRWNSYVALSLIPPSVRPCRPAAGCDRDRTAGPRRQPDERHRTCPPRAREGWLGHAAPRRRHQPPDPGLPGRHRLEHCRPAASARPIRAAPNAGPGHDRPGPAHRRRRPQAGRRHPLAGPPARHRCRQAPRDARFRPMPWPTFWACKVPPWASPSWRSAPLPPPPPTSWPASWAAMPS